MPTYQIGGVTTQDAANQAAVGSAVVGTAIGALAGAAIGGSQGAAVGAGVGLVGGSAVGTSSAYASGYGYPAPVRQRLHPVHVRQGAPCAGAGQHGLPERGQPGERRYSATTTGCATPATTRGSATAAPIKPVAQATDISIAPSTEVPFFISEIAFANYLS